jgi:pilus assembly protein FimV
MDFDLEFPSKPAALMDSQPRAPASVKSVLDQPTFDLGDSLPNLNFDEPSVAAAPNTAVEPPAVAGLTAPVTGSAEYPRYGIRWSMAGLTAPVKGSAERMSFDLSDAELDLEAPASSETAGDGLTEENSLDTKLSLAEEFRAIGDLEGARSLAEEVLAEASGTLKAKASVFLAELS